MTNKSFNIETNRLKLRQLDESDNFLLHEILSDIETMKYYPAPYDLKGTESWINRSMESYIENGFGLWALVLKSVETFIGQCGITYTNIDGDKFPEIGYHINKKFWNQGLATEAAFAVMNYGFNNFQLKEIFIHTWVENIPSRKVAEKIGMVKVKEFDKHNQKRKEIRKHIVYSMKG